MCVFLFSWENTSKIRPALAFKDTDEMINAFLLRLIYCSDYVRAFTEILQLSSSYDAAAFIWEIPQHFQISLSGCQFCGKHFMIEYTCEYFLKTTAPGRQVI